MEDKLNITYSNDFEILNTGLHLGDCLHMICTAGGGSFIYNEREFQFKQGDAVVISKPEVFRDAKADKGTTVESLVAPLQYLYNQMPANHFGIGGCIDLWENPIIPLTEEGQNAFITDIHRLRDRLTETGHAFYKEMIGSLSLTMVYDLFDAHSKNRVSGISTERTTDLVAELTAMLSSGKVKEQRELAYYAEQLHVSTKYLSNLIKRQTGRSFTFMVDQYTVPMIIDYLKNKHLSLSQIADEFHFTSLSYFSRYVQKHLGVSPSEYRASKQPKR